MTDRTISAIFRLQSCATASVEAHWKESNSGNIRPVSAWRKKLVQRQFSKEIVERALFATKRCSCLSARYSKRPRSRKSALTNRSPDSSNASRIAVWLSVSPGSTPPFRMSHRFDHVAWPSSTSFRSLSRMMPQDRETFRDVVMEISERLDVGDSNPNDSVSLP